MKGSDLFKQTIKNYLDGRASKDPLFAESYKNPSKNIEECIRFIFQEVQKSGKNGFADEEIYGMAIHYYDELNIKVDNKNINCQVVVNHAVEEEPKEEPKPETKSVPEVVVKATRKKKAKYEDVGQLSFF